MVHQELNLVRQTSVMDNYGWVATQLKVVLLWITPKCIVIPSDFR